MKRLNMLLALVAILMVSMSQIVGATNNGRDKVTLCHAAGLDGTTKFVTITVGYPAAFGPAGHFYENGTTRAGHEQDYLGECEEETTTTTEATTTTTEATTTTTEATTTTTEQETTTTTERKKPRPTTTTTAVPYDTLPTTTAPAGPATTTTSPPQTELPYTGFNTGLAALGALSLALMGLVLVRR